MKLALIGKNISHSQSEKIYKRFYKNLTYTLIDIDSEEELPSLENLFNEFDGVSITSPYKENYFDNVETLDDLEELKIINTIKQTPSGYLGTLTDLNAFEEIFTESFKDKVEKKHLPIYILGDGNMAKMVKSYLDKSSRDYQQFSRKLDNLADFENNNSLKEALIINTCSRDYIFSGSIHQYSYFWDFNYLHPHESIIAQSQYISGLELLERQAIYAMKFWQSN